MKPIELCSTCREYDGGRCLVGICAAVRCWMIAQGWPISPDPVRPAGPVTVRRAEQ